MIKNFVLTVSNNPVFVATEESPARRMEAKKRGGVFRDLYGVGVREIYVARLPVPVYTTGPNFFTTNPYFQKKNFSHPNITTPSER